MDRASVGSELRKIVAAARRHDRSVRAQLAEIDRCASEQEAPPKYEAFAGALEERDRQLADLQREADSRLAMVERVTKDAQERLELLEQAAAAARELRETLLSRDLTINSLRSQLEQVTAAAAERLVAIEQLDAAVTNLRQQLEAASQAAQERFELLEASRAPSARQ